MKIIQSHNCSLSANMCSYLPNYLTTVHPQAKVPLHLLVGDLRGGVLGGAPLLVDHDGILPDITARDQDHERSKQMMRSASDILEQDEVEHVGGDGEVELADDHADDVGDEEDTGEEEDTDKVTKLLNIFLLLHTPSTSKESTIVLLRSR